MQKCVYKLTVKSSPELELKEGERITDQLKEAESRIYRFYVPPDTEIHSLLVDLGVSGNSSMIRMFVTQANDPDTLPSVSNTLYVIPSWFGLSARVYEDNTYSFCRNCTYKVLITANEETMYDLKYSTTKSVARITEDVYQTFEVVYAGERNCYEYIVKDSSDLFEIHLNTFSGDPNIYVNPKILPKEEANFAFSSKGELDEVLSITSEQRRTAGQIIGPYYVCIFGSRTSSYSLMINSVKEGENIVIPIYSGLTRTEMIKKDALKVYEYSLFGQESTNITFTLTSIAGNADLYIKFCIEELNDYGIPTRPCEMTKNTIVNEGKIAKSEQTSSADVITLQYSNKDCVGQTKRCVYLVGVLGRTDTRYSLSVLGDPMDESPLVEGKAFFGYVGLRQSIYYSFTVDDPKTESVKIQLTSLSGDADLFVSRVKQGDRWNSERYSNQQSFMPDAIHFDRTRDGNLNTTYHLTIYGHTSATFTISYTTTISGGQEKPMLIYEGIPQAGAINGTTLETSGVRYYFYFRTRANETQDIEISLTPITGKYRMYVGANYLPTPSNYTWVMGETERNLHILANDPNYNMNAKYNIYLAKLFTEETSPHIFTVGYTTGRFATSISEGQPEMGNLTRGEFKYYKYNVISDEGSISITVTPFSGDPDLYISINSTNDKPDSFSADYTSVAIGADLIKVPTSEISKKSPNCKFGAYTSSSCAIYVGVKCASDICTYSLMVGRTASMVLQLLDGTPQFGSIAGGDPQYYVFNPSNITESTIISLYPKKGKVKAFVKLVPWSFIPEDPERPTPEKHDVSSHSRANTEVLEISPDQAKNCGYLCRYYIGVFVDVGELRPGQNADSEFNIVATTGIRTLIDGQTVVDFIGEKAYKYYRFNVPCRECTLSISLTPLSSGDPDLYVNRGQYRLPSSENADFRAISYRGDFLQISHNDPQIKDHRRMMQGNYLIAVYGSQNCTYALTATTSASVVQEVSVGIPVRQEVTQGTISYFTFNSWKKSDISISLQMHSGRANIRANVVESVRESSVLDKLPSTEVKSTWSSLSQNSVNSLSISKDHPQYKEYGIYFVAVEAEEASNYDLTIEYSNDEDYTFMRISEAYRVKLRENEVKKFKFEVTNQENIMVQLSFFYGNVEGSITTAPNGEPIWNLQLNQGVVISKTHEKFKIGTYYMKIKGVHDCDFAIIVEQNLQVTWLSEGLPQKASLESGKPSYFFYSIPKNNREEDARFNVYATLKSSDVTNQAIYIRHITRADPSMPNAYNYDYKSSWDPELKQLGVSIAINSTRSNTLAIAVSGELIIPSAANLKSEFNIMAWSTGFAMLVPGSVYSNKFTSLNQIHVYQLSVPKTARAYIEVNPCVGEVEFFVAQKLSSMTDRKFDLKKTELNKGKLFGVLQDVEGTYYISVRALGFSSLDSERNRGIQYTIKSIISNETVVDYLEDFSLGSYGNIDTYLDGGSLTLTWGAPYFRGTNVAKYITIKYSVYMTEDTGANLYTICGIKYGSTKKIASDLSESKYTVDIRDKMDAKKLAFSVIATVKEYDYAVAYNPVYFQVPAPPKMFRIHFIVIILLLFILGGAAIYFWRKYRQAVKQLQYEMNDVRNLGNISTTREVPESKTEAYLHLRSGTEEQ